MGIPKKFKHNRVNKRFYTKSNEKVEDYEQIKKGILLKRIGRLLGFKEFNPKQKSLVRKFYDYMQRKGLQLESQRGYLQNLKLLILNLNKDFDELTDSDINSYLAKIDRDFKPKTITERRKFLKLFFEWYERPKLVEGIKIKKDNGTKLPDEILSPEEIKKMVQVADNFRDKAMIILLYETAARKGEFLQLKIKHVDLSNEKYGMILIPQGKTIPRKIPIIYSVPHLTHWLNTHPNRDDPNAPLFITQGAWLGRAMGEDGLKRLIKIIGKRAGITKKIYPHLLRHSRLTELAKEITEQEMKIFAGWTPGSNMTKVYVHLSGSDVSNKILSNAGLIDSETIKSKQKVLEKIICPRCNKVNSFDEKYCDCGFVLDLKTAQKEIESTIETRSDLIKVKKDLEIMHNKMNGLVEAHAVSQKFVEKEKRAPRVADIEDLKSLIKAMVNKGELKI